MLKLMLISSACFRILLSATEVCHFFLDLGNLKWELTAKSLPQYPEYPFQS